MKPDGLLLAIFIAPAKGAEPVAVESVEAIPGQGLEGDRYAAGTGTWSGRGEWWNEVTLIEIETVDALRAEGFGVGAADLRRNLLTRGVALSGLEGREFSIGAVRLRGERPCDPCRYLEGRTAPGLKQALEGRGGLRATILTGGELRAGDAIRIIPPAPGGPAAD